MKILKYQGGGFSLPSTHIDYSTLYMTYLAQKQQNKAEAPSAASAYQSDEKGAIGIFTKSMTDDVMKNVLPVDGRELIDMSVHFEEYINPYRPSSAKAVYTSILQKLQQAKYEQDLYTKAVDNARSKGTLQAPAISTSNTVWVKKGKGITEVDVRNVKPGDRVLTVGEIAQLRAYNPAFAGNQDAILAIEQSTSMKDIQDQIDDALSSIPMSGGTTTTFGTRQQLLAQGYQEILGTSVEGVYKLKVTQKSNVKAVNAVLKYVYDTLQDNQRAYLTLIAKKAGLSAKGPNNESLDPVQVLLMEFVQGKYQFDNDYEATFEKDQTEIMIGELPGSSKSKSKSSEKGLEDIEANATTDFFLQMGEKKGVQIKIGRVTYQGIGTKSTLVDGEGKPLGGMTLLTNVDNSEMAFGMDVSQMHFGSARVNDTSKDKIIVDGGSLINIALPIDLQALSVGEIRPDFKMFQQATKAQREAKGLTDIRKINQIYAKYGLAPIYKLGTNGEPELQATYRQFAVLHGYADRSALRKSKLGDDIDLNITIQKVTDSDDADSIVETIKEFNKGYKPSKDFPIPHPWRSDDIYEGSIFIPIYESPISYLGKIKHTMGNSMTLTEAQHYNERAETLPQQYRKTPKLNY